MKKFLAIILTAALMAILITLSGCSAGTKNIDFKEYTKVTFEGKSGSGYATVEIDYDAIAALLGDQNSVSAFSTVSSFKAAKIENNDSLANGDKVKVKIEYNENVLKNAKLSVTNTEMEFEVSGLEEKEKLDVFKDVKIYVFPVEGDENKCNINISYTNDDNYFTSRIYSYVFEVVGENGNKWNTDNKDVFTIGEKITVSFSEKFYSDNKYSLLGSYELVETSKEFIIGDEDTSIFPN